MGNYIFKNFYFYSFLQQNKWQIEIRVLRLITLILRKIENIIDPLPNDEKFVVIFAIELTKKYDAS